MPIGQPLITLQEVDSTNNYAKAQLRAEMACHGTVWMAIHQTQGRGQRQNQWLSEAGKNLTLSVVINPFPLQLSEQHKLLTAVALACRQFVQNFIIPSVSIKPPNDIYVNGKKIAGILIENSVTNSVWKTAIVGIGININQLHFEGAATHATSLKMLTGIDYQLTEMAHLLCNFLENHWQLLLQGPYDTLQTQYNCFSAKPFDLI